MITVTRITTALLLTGLALHLQAQTSTRKKDPLKIYLTTDSACYVKATGLAQVWLRYNTNNPGSAIYGTPVNETFDVGLRRVRYQVMAQVTKRVFLYTQVGINSVNALSARKTGLFFHDVTAEYEIFRKHLTIGAGLSGWNGTARFSSSGTGGILALDLPVVQETTNDVNDQFVRKPGVYLKGELIRLNYRFSASNPFPVQNALTTVAAMPQNEINTSYFSARAPEIQYQGYFMWQFLDKENTQLPYMNGCYLGTKKIFNIGSGFAFQNDAMWHRNAGGDTISSPLKQFGADIFYDSYIDREKQNAITFYAAYLRYDFGPNYIRNAGAMNTANSLSGKASFNGTGNAYPLIGTGDVVYAQAGYLFRKDLLGAEGTLQPYGCLIAANYERLNDPVMVYHAGINWLIDRHNAKISFDYESRPVFNINSSGSIKEVKNARRGQAVLQFQLAF